MGHIFRANKVEKIYKDGEHIIIQLEWCNDNDIGFFEITDSNPNINVFEKFKPGTNVVTDCHECRYDEDQEGDIIKAVRDGFFDESEKLGHLVEPVEFKSEYDFKTDKMKVPEDEVYVFPW